MTTRSNSRMIAPVDREATAERHDLLAHPGLHRGVTFRRLAQRLQHVADQPADLAELGHAEAAAAAGGGAKADARGDGRLLRVARHAVLVAGDPGALQRLG